MHTCLFAPVTLVCHGRMQVYGVDVGYGQVADKLRRDARVTVIERFNLRYLKPSDLPTPVHLATLDLAFISVLKVCLAFPGSCGQHLPAA